MVETQIEAFFDNQLQIYCPDIKLTQMGDPESPHSYQGQGIIRKDQPGEFKLEIFPAEDHNLIGDMLERLTSFKRGKLIPKSYYYSLDAVDIKNNNWSALQVNLDDSQFGQKGSVLKGTFKKLTFQNEKITTSPFIDLFVDEVDLPTNQNITEYKVKGGETIHKAVKLDLTEFETFKYKVSIDHNKKIQKITIEPKNIEHNFTVQEAWIILNAFRFITAKRIQARLMKIGGSGGQLCHLIAEREEKVYGPIINPPLLTNDIEDEIADLWKLFSKYIKFVIQQESNRLSRIVNRNISASEGSLYAFAVTVSLSIEEILKLYFKDYSDIDDKDLDRFKDAKPKLDDLSLDENLIDRLKESLDYYKQSKAINMLRGLKNECDISEDLIKKWRKLRSIVAHPGRKVVGTHKLLTLAYASLTLFYKLIFIKIGYSGPFSNYSKENWPIENFKI